MKVSKLIMPMVALSVMSNNQVQVEATTKAECIQDCVAIHSAAAKACCNVAVYNPIVFAGCMALAGGSLTLCLAGCSAMRQ